MVLAEAPPARVVVEAPLGLDHQAVALLAVHLQTFPMAPLMAEVGALQVQALQFVAQTAMTASPMVAVPTEAQVRAPDLASVGQWRGV